MRKITNLYRNRVDFHICVHHLAAAAQEFARWDGSSYRFIANEYSEPRIELVKSEASVLLSATDEWGSPYEGWALRVLMLDDFLYAWA
jgi:hypothetical protein